MEVQVIGLVGAGLGGPGLRPFTLTLSLNPQGDLSRVTLEVTACLTTGRVVWLLGRYRAGLYSSLGSHLGLWTPQN